MAAITGAVSSVIGVVGQCVTFMTDTPLMLFFLAASLIPVGFAIFKGAKRAAKR